jgi:hypothetical protein
VLREVEAGGFVFGGDAQADRFVDEEEQDQGAHDGDDPGDGDADGLVQS